MKKFFLIAIPLILLMTSLYIGKVYAPISWEPENKKENLYPPKWLLKADSARTFVNSKNLNS